MPVIKYRLDSKSEFENIPTMVGARGKKGQTGNKGYTPQKGVDYWIEEDIQAILNRAQNLYTELEYITSTSNQYLIIPFIPETGDKLEIDFKLTTAVSNATYYICASGAYSSDTTKKYGSLRWYNNSSYLSTEGYGFYFDIPNPPKLNRTIGRGDFNGKYTGYLYICKRENATSAAPMNIYSITYYRAKENKWYYYIPVRDYDDIPCLFDKTDKKFIYSQSANHFAAGPVKEG